jgi:hypothetical protein
MIDKKVKKDEKSRSKSSLPTKPNNSRKINSKSPRRMVILFSGCGRYQRKAGYQVQIPIDEY